MQSPSSRVSLSLSILVTFFLVSCVVGQGTHDESQPQIPQQEQQDQQNEGQDEQSHQPQQQQQPQQQEEQDNNQQQQQQQPQSQSEDEGRGSPHYHQYDERYPPSSASHNDRESGSDPSDGSEHRVPQAMHASHASSAPSAQTSYDSNERPVTSYHHSDHGHSPLGKPSVNVYSFLGAGPSGHGSQDSGNDGSLGGSESQAGFRYSISSYPTHGPSHAASASSSSSSSSPSDARGAHVTSYYIPTSSHDSTGGSGGRSWSQAGGGPSAARTHSYHS